MTTRLSDSVLYQHLWGTAEAKTTLDGWIGSEDGQNYFFSGSIAEVTVFDTALSPTAITTLLGW